MPNVLRRIAYIADWLPRYTWAHLRGDLLAGLTVGVMLIPQGMAYAMLAGLPPIYGLYASLVPLVVYPIFGTSRHLAVGVIAIDMVIVAVGVAPLAGGDAARYIELAMLLALMVGAVQLLMGVTRLGFVVNLLSRPVLIGFSSAAALIIGLSQLGNLLGLALPRSQQVFVVLREAAQHIGQIELWSLALGVGGVALLVGLGRWKKLIPAPLVVVVLGTLLVWKFGMHEQGVAVVGAVPTGLPAPRLAAVQTADLQALLPTALTLVLVQVMSVVALGKVFAARHRYAIDANRELVAIGSANILGSVFRSIPVSGSFSRTAVNAQAGARTPLANVFAAALIALTLLFLTPLFYHLPVPVLAAIIMVAAFGLIDVKEVRYLLRVKRIDGFLALLTFCATLLIGIQEGVFLGVVASVVAIMYRISRPNVAILGHLPGTRSFRDLHRHSEAKPIEGILMLRVDASFSFANAEFVKDLILEGSLYPPVRAVVLDASSVNDLDMTAVSVLFFVAETLRDRGVAFYITGVKGTVQGVMERSGLRDELGEDHLLLSPHRAVKEILQSWGRSAAYLETVPGEPHADDLEA